MKRLIYIGAIFDWMDIELVEKLCEKHEVMMAGEKRIELPAGVNYVGKLAVADVPKFIAKNEVGIIPFLRNALTLDINNSKIYQFYALGLPVVSTLDNHASRDAEVLTGNNHKSFLANIEKTDKINRETLVEIARQNDWQKQADRFAQELLNLSKNRLA
ncbi:MAG: hypothetical protein DWQ05_12390 [Calditrichaeota bacterium]|nr:MAG: hypothetical protein DWQ05_12390 [Calditrichota bacterium]